MTDECHRTGIVCVLETDPTGHRLQFVRHLVAAEGPDRCVVLTTRQVIESEEFATHLDSTIRVVDLLDGASRADTLDTALRWASATAARLLVIPDGDKYVIPLLRYALVRRRCSPEIRLLIMRTATVGGFERTKLAMLVKPLMVQLLRLRPGVRVFFLTDALGIVCRRRGYRGVLPVRDPVSKPTTNRSRRPDWLPSTSAVTVVGHFGRISARKNLPLLVRAVAGIPHAVLVVAGRFETDTRRFVETDPTARELRVQGRLILVDRLLDADEFGDGLAAVDLVAVLHDNDSPSGILAEACVRGTPVLVPRGGWLHQVVEAAGVGAAVPMTAAGVAAGITQIAAGHGAFVQATRTSSAVIGTDDFSDRLLAR